MSTRGRYVVTLYVSGLWEFSGLLLTAAQLDREVRAPSPPTQAFSLR
jgi:hypothetical protein